MKFTDVLTATDTNPLYYKFVPIFIRAWKKLFPEIKIHIILISDKIIPELEPYSEFIKLFPPLKNIKTSFIAQNIRLFYPCLLKTEGGVLITDMDIIPMNTNYYVEPIKNIEDDKFICYRQLECVGKNEMVICYNIALPETWRQIFSIKTIADINYILEYILNNNMKYVGHYNMPFWITDQLYLYECTQQWNYVNNGRLIILNDNLTKFKRLDRNKFPDYLTLINYIKEKKYTDFHMYRPYENYKEINEKIVELCQV
tara:strand:+ start:73 stop:843 length:771 start_codon:yes stop_codon:yes gene_type:complete